MPRRALVLITILVLALHWLVLRGVPLAWNVPEAQDGGRVFSTRSIVAAADPPTPAAVHAPPPVTPAVRPPAARPRPSAPPKAAVTPTTPAPPPTPDLPPSAAPSADEPGTPPDAQPPAVVPPPADAPTASPEAPAAASTAPEEPTTPTPAAVAASAPQPPDTAAGVDIALPGTGPRQSPGTPSPPVRLPPPARLAFDVSGQAKKFAYSARADLWWQHDGARYEARQEISAFLVGTRAQRSVGAITAQGLQPERFSDKSRSEQAAHFDLAKGRVTFSANTPDAAVGPGAQDRLSVFIQLGALLAADPGRFVPGTQITLTTVSARSADRWTFSMEGPETLDLPVGTTATLKLQRLPRKDYDQKAELWVAPALGYLPVRIRITQANGDFADLLLRATSTP